MRGIKLTWDQPDSGLWVATGESGIRCLDVSEERYVSGLTPEAEIRLVGDRYILKHSGRQGGIPSRRAGYNMDSLEKAMTRAERWAAKRFRVEE